MALFNLATGFCKSRIPFDVCRAFAGIGAALASESGRFIPYFAEMTCR